MEPQDATARDGARPAAGAKAILTVGHSTHPIEEFLDILRAHGVERLVDVRTAPGSKRYPQFNRDQLEQSLREAGIDYLHLKGLGGFRKPRSDSPNAAWKNASFRGYADYMLSDEFRENLKKLLAAAEEKRTAIMCSEAVPWRCHRSLISDALLARGIPVEDIFSALKREPHHLTRFGRVEGDQVTYPAVDGQNATLYDNT